MNKKNEYGKGKMNATKEMISFVQKQIISIKDQRPLPNSNRQITNGGKLLAYNKVLQKLMVKMNKINEHI
jgi:hypothetical protein